MEQTEHGAIEEQLEVFRRSGFQMFEQILSHVLLLEMKRNEPARSGNPTRIPIESGKANRQTQVRQAKVNIDVRVSGADSGVMTTERRSDFVVRLKSQSHAQARAHVRHQPRQPTIQTRLRLCVRIFGNR